MKKLVYLIALIVLFWGCTNHSNTNQNESTAYVRFMNSSPGHMFTQYGGIKCGDAIFEGQIKSLYVTSYIATEPGSFLVELMTPNSQWIPASLGYIPVTGGKYITIYINLTNPTIDEDGNIITATDYSFTYITTDS